MQVIYFSVIFYLLVLNSDQKPGVPVDTFIQNLQSMEGVGVVWGCEEDD